MRALDIAVAGIHQGQARGIRAAQAISKDPEDIGAYVDLKMAKHAVSASAKVAKTSDEMIGSLIDTLA